jgi:hypothetical protein
MNKFIVYYLVILTVFILFLVMRCKGYLKVGNHYVWNSTKPELRIGGNNSNSQLIFDEFTISHLSAAVLYYSVGLLLKVNPVNTVIVGAITWEVLENMPFAIDIQKKTYPEYNGDALINSLSDVFVAIVVSQILRFTKINLFQCVILFLYFELFSYLAYRDGILTYLVRQIK